LFLQGCILQFPREYGRGECFVQSEPLTGSFIYAGIRVLPYGGRDLVRLNLI
jgi:hypothetical protein